VGEENPAEFMRYYRTDNAYVAACAFAQELPNFYGIMLKGDWASAFNQEFQHSREEVVAGIVEYLEETRKDWAEAVAEFAVAEDKRYEPLQDHQVDEFLNEQIVFKGVDPIPMQHAEIDQLRPFKEMPFPKSSWYEESVTQKVLVNAPTDQEIETRMLQKRSGVTSEVIEKYAALAGDDENGEGEEGGE
jgi:hypothetical protein